MERQAAALRRFEEGWFQALAPALPRDPLYARISGHLTVRILFAESDRAALVRLDGGRIVGVQAPPPLMVPWDLAIRGEPAAWDDLLAPVPPPRCQSIFALAKAGRMRVEGNWLVAMQNLWALTRLVELMRAHSAPGGSAGHAAA